MIATLKDTNNRTTLNTAKDTECSNNTALNNDRNTLLNNNSKDNNRNPPTKLNNNLPTNSTNHNNNPNNLNPERKPPTRRSLRTEELPLFRVNSDRRVSSSRDTDTVDMDTINKRCNISKRCSNNSSSSKRSSSRVAERAHRDRALELIKDLVLRKILIEVSFNYYSLPPSLLHLSPRLYSTPYDSLSSRSVLPSSLLPSYSVS